MISLRFNTAAFNKEMKNIWRSKHFSLPCLLLASKCQPIVIVLELPETEIY
jgi:hypothetical protein